jgi:HJR/Mrr/RecB family endonuclease
MFRLLTKAATSLLWVLGGLLALVWTAYENYPHLTVFIGSVLVLLLCWGSDVARKRREALVDARMRDEIVPAMSPTEYEQFVARLLSRYGWNATHCGETGDQGCDVLAELRGFRAVVQVKHYLGRCPNSAVQQAVGARLHRGAQIMVVVAPNGFTRSARELARANGVHLLHHSALDTLERLARIP